MTKITPYDPDDVTIARILAESQGVIIWHLGRAFVLSPLIIECGMYCP